MSAGEGGEVVEMVHVRCDGEMGMDCTRCELSCDRRMVALLLGREVTANSV